MSPAPHGLSPGAFAALGRPACESTGVVAGRPSAEVGRRPESPRATSTTTGQRTQRATESYIREVASPSAADELTKLGQPRDQGIRHLT